jgi:hypothetical protein
MLAVKNITQTRIRISVIQYYGDFLKWKLLGVKLSEQKCFIAQTLDLPRKMKYVLNEMKVKVSKVADLPGFE